MKLVLPQKNDKMLAMEAFNAMRMGIPLFAGFFPRDSSSHGHKLLILETVNLAEAIIES